MSIIKLKYQIRKEVKEWMKNEGKIREWRANFKKWMENVQSAESQ
jgi:hypothetical protein